MTELIERELHLDAEPAAAWQALIDPELLSRWLADEAAIEPWIGGDVRFRIGDQIRAGWVEEISPPDEHGRAGRLVFWWSEDGEPASRVALELDATERGSRVRVVETRPLEVLDLVGIPLGGYGGATRYGPALIAA